MALKNYKIIMLFLTAFLSSTVVGETKDDGEKKSSASPPKEETEKGKKKIPPLPRYVLIPELTYSRLPDEEGEFSMELTQHRFWFILLLASWNQRSTDITKIFNYYHKEMIKNDIGVLGLFYQNSVKDVDKWREKNKPLFDTYFASRVFMDKVKNPPIPSFWLVSSKGQILLKRELPTFQQIDTSIKKSFILTGF